MRAIAVCENYHTETRLHLYSVMGFIHEVRRHISVHGGVGYPGVTHYKVDSIIAYLVSFPSLYIIKKVYENIEV